MNVALDHFRMLVGERIHAQRKARGMSLAKLAAEIGCNREVIAGAEEGRSCSLYLAAQIAEALDVTLDDIVPIDALGNAVAADPVSP